uniref:RNA-directed RNA polymerase n=1 Tax=Cane toad associated toti-like virus 3 TaxID=2859900 RepID=A0A8F6UB16_9VIRU|nr:hypothetical protein [Cane toad associated toti-like virus 3]
MASWWGTSRSTGNTTAVQRVVPRWFAWAERVFSGTGAVLRRCSTASGTEGGFPRCVERNEPGGGERRGECQRGGVEQPRGCGRLHFQRVIMSTLADAELDLTWTNVLWVNILAELKPVDTVLEWNDDPSFHRCRYSSSTMLGLGVFTPPLSFYADVLAQSYGRDVGTPFWVLKTIQHRCMSTSNPELACFQHLKALSNTVQTQLSGDLALQGQLFVGLERASPARVWTKPALIDDLKNWLAPEKTWAADPIVKKWVIKTVNGMFYHWTKGMAMDGRQNLSFVEFCNDPLRWATAGGGPAVVWDGVRHRTKWAWAMYHLERGNDIYSQALKLPNIAHCALKEEPTKTRLVITTPMASYLRQSYVMYLFGTPEFRSPLHSNRELHDLSRRIYGCYESIDAKAFDHQIPLWFIQLIVNKLFQSVGMYELLRDEQEHIRGLTVELFGVNYPYKGGLLSGWRLTSFIGTLASELICRWMDTTQPASYVVQGDDILRYSDQWLDAQFLDMLDWFGLAYDKQASMPSRGGYFLQRYYGGHYSTMSPARALRSIFYASPWIERQQFVNPSSLANVWLQFCSRIPCRVARNWVLRQAAYDMCRWARWPGWSVRKWFDLLTTDQGLGGLGTVDTHIEREILPQITEHEVSATVTRGDWKRLFSYFVPSRSSTARGLQVFYRYRVMDVPNPIKMRSVPIVPMEWFQRSNQTAVCLGVMRHGVAALPSDVYRQLPHWLRRQPWFRVLDWILKPKDVAAPRCLSVQQIVLNDAVHAHRRMADRMLSRWRSGLIFKKFGLYRTVLSFATQLVFPVGSW